MSVRFPSWPNRVLGVLLLATCGLLWLVHDRPRQLGLIYVDAWSAFVSLVTVAGLALAAYAAPPRHWWRECWLPLGALGIGLCVAATPVIVLAYGVLAALANGPALASVRSANGLRRVFHAAPLAVAAACLALGYGALAARGALRYDARTAGAALDGFVFLFTLLAALVPQVRLFAAEQRPAERVWRLVWLYPLVRLYSLGPWNSGWSFAALLLAVAVAAWSTFGALVANDGPTRSRLMWRSMAGLALAGFALGTSAGVAAGCYLMVACLLLPGAEGPDGAAAERTGWTLVGALPFAASFVGVWMLVGAATAASLTAVAGVAWLIALLCGVAWALGVASAPSDDDLLRGMLGITAPPVTPALVRAALGIVLGVAAPVVVALAIQPVVAQLQGGLSVYGDIVVAPWIGMVALDSAKTQVAALPSIAVAGLMAVLLALVYLVARLLATSHAATAPEGSPSAVRTIIRSVRAEVPWLGEDRHRDGE